jgi:hypothetical protein
VKIFILGALVSVGLALTPASAFADGRAGSKKDRAGDTNAPQYDIKKLAASYDGKGGVRASVTLAALPTSANPAAIAVLFGRRSGGRCVIRKATGMLIGGDVPEGERIFGTKDGKLDPPTVTTEGTTVTFKGADRSLAGKKWECARIIAGHPDASEESDTLENVVLARRRSR